MEVAAREDAELHTSTSAPTWVQRLRNVGRRALPKGWSRSSQGFTQLAVEEEAPGTATGIHRPAGRWCPEEDAGFLSRLFYCYVDGILRLGYSKPLVQEDVWDIAPRDEAPTVSAAFDDCLTSDPHRGVVVRAMWKLCGRAFVRAGLLKLVHDLCMFTGPLFLQELLKALQDGRSAWVGLALALGLAGSNVVETLLINSYFHILFRVSLHLKVSLIDMLFSKSLRIGSGVRSKYGVGSITNLQSNDAAKLYNLSQYLHMLWSGPLQILVVMGMLVRVIHWIPAACGLVSTVAMIPGSIVTGRRLAAIRKELMLRTDARIKLCSEVVTGIKAIKLYAWEDPYVSRVSALRERELEAIRRAALWGILNSVIFFGGPIIIALTSFTVYAAMGYPLTADVAFVSLALFNLLRFPVMMFPNQIMNIINGKVALGRIQKFMEEPDLVQPELRPRADAHGAAMRIGGGSFAYAAGGDPALTGVDLEVLDGQLLMVVGEVGAGKTSLLLALLGEMAVLAGEAVVNGTIAYTSQDPWIQNASLRDNILSGNVFDEARYDAVLDACALRTDLELLPAGDQSEIGEKGINLSGGQRHRVALARACYAESDIVLLDDPLSAVDAHVGQQLWAGCICGLLAARTRVLVTHSTHLLRHADLVAVVLGGRVTHLGTYEALEAEVDFHAFEMADAEPADQAPPRDGEAATPAGVIGNTAFSTLEATTPHSQESQLPSAHGILQPENGHANGRVGTDDASASSSRSSSEDDSGKGPGGGGGKTSAAHAAEVEMGRLETDAVHLPSVLSADLDDVTDRGPLPGLDKKEDIILTIEEEEQHEHIALIPAKLDAQDKGKIVKAEDRATGSVQRSVYWAYISAWGPLWLPIIIACSAIVERSCSIGQNYWLKVWSDATTEASRAARRPNTPLYMSVYFVLGMALLVLMVVRSAAVIMGTVNAARKLHADLLRKVVRMPMSFFDSQPTGRLLNRFSRDTEALDTSLGNTVSSFLTCSVSVAGAMLVVLAVTPGVLIAVIPLTVAYRYVQRVYLASSRELKRLDSLAMSPIFGHFSETIAGLLTLRAFRLQRLSTDRNHAKLNHSNRVYWVMQNVNRWLSVRLELLGISIVLATAVIVTVFPTNAGLAGLALTSALNLTGLMNWMTRMSAEMEVSMNSVERMVEYESMDAEAPAVIQDNRPPIDWPSQGAIKFDDLVVRYRPDLPPVIHGLSFDVGAQEKIGVAGRTGCGKSTLMMALYRLVEPSGGSITIDGVDVAGIGLADLRGRLALVPQDPVIFSGTVRSNLDPFGEAEGDDAVWGALTQAGLADSVRAMKGGLEASMSEGGGNLSTGQRQLLCMARALLRHAKILVLDEATSNVDPATDGLIQATIRTAFADCTTLTIAHRLHTILDADRILILEAGRLLEFDRPKTLMKDPSSALSKLLAETKSMARGST